MPTKNAISVILLIFGITPAYGQSAGSPFFYRIGDVAGVCNVDGVEAGDCGDNVVWDFSDSSQGVSTADNASMAPTDSLPDISGYGTTERIAYSGNTVYRNGKLGGYCTFENGSDSPTFHYFTQDHLGNNRVVTNEDGTVEQITHYYPFGGPFGDAGLNPELQPYKYNGKELDHMFGLDTYDYGARQYFPALPVWDRMDPRCEIDYNVSPYAYCRNSPVNKIDYYGMFYGDYYNERGKWLGNDGIDDGNVYVMRITSSFLEEYDGMAKVSNISRKQAIAASNEIKTHSGDSTYSFENVRSSFVKLDGTQETRDQIFLSIGDDGKGGVSSGNNTEYGAYFDKDNPNDIHFVHGYSDDVNSNNEVSVVVKDNKGYIMVHTHPSGESNFFGMSHQYSFWTQPPSDQDLKGANDNNNYVISMGYKMIYIYNKTDGVYARFPLKIFTTKYK